MLVLDSRDFMLEMSAKVFQKDPVMNNTILHVVVRSNDFAGAMDMDVGINELERFVKQIHAMNASVKGAAELKETYGESYIRMEIDKCGHVLVSGFINASDHQLHFRNEFELLCLDQFDKALANSGSWQVVV